jgi:C-terminal processing protease CtpA/Prc
MSYQSALLSSKRSKLTIRRRGRTTCLFATLIVLTATIATAQALPSETDRLIATAKLWVTVKYFHPYIASRDLDWDQALINTLPKIRAAQTPAEYESAVHSLMAGLESAPRPSTTGQRVWIHHGLAPESGGPSNRFYSAFLYKPSKQPETIDVPMGGFSVNVLLSEPPNGSALPLGNPPRIYSDAYPASELRILAAYKIWGVFHYFFAYRDLMDEDWDGLLPEFLSRLIAAKDAQEYNLAIAEWLTHSADSLVKIDSATISNYFGEAPVGLRLRVVEKHVVITEILDPEAVQAGIKIGDVVKKVDGETLVERFKRQAQFVSASTLQRLGVDVTNRLLNGADGSSAALTLEDNAGNRREVSLKRAKRFAEPLQTETPGESFKLLRGGIGYADLRRLRHSEVESMYEKFRNAPAIIFDLRGVPADDSITAIAPRLTAERDVPAAIFTGPIIATPDLQQGAIAGSSSSYFFVQTIGNSPLWKYEGKTAMLVDERTIGGGEHAALFLEAANKTEVIGTPTAGADTLVSNFSVPGGIMIALSGEDIRHSNGGKLQRTGLQPNVNAAPTLSGIRTGKDEVLEKALEHLLPKPTTPTVLPSKARLSTPLVNGNAAQSHVYSF